MSKSISNNRSNSQKEAAKKRRQTWKPGESGNPKGAPKRGESWKELYTQIGNMTGEEAYKFCAEVAEQIKTIRGVTLKQAVVLRVYTALLFEPDARLLNAAMDRDEGKVTQPIEMAWRERAIKLGYDPEKLIDEIEREIAARSIGSGDSGSIGAVIVQDSQ